MKRLKSFVLAAVLVALTSTAATAGPVAAAIPAIAAVWAAIGPLGELAVTIGVQIGVPLAKECTITVKGLSACRR